MYGSPLRYGLQFFCIIGSVAGKVNPIKVAGYAHRMIPGFGVCMGLVTGDTSAYGAIAPVYRICSQRAPHRYRNGLVGAISIPYSDKVVERRALYRNSYSIRSFTVARISYGKRKLQFSVLVYGGRRKRWRGGVRAGQRDVRSAGLLPRICQGLIFGVSGSSTV